MIGAKLEGPTDIDDINTVLKHPEIRMSFSYNVDDEYNSSRE